MPRAPSERDPLCSLATNRGNDGMQGKWRLAIAIVLCTIFMIGEVGWPGLLALQFVALHGQSRAASFAQQGDLAELSCQPCSCWLYVGKSLLLGGRTLPGIVETGCLGWPDSPRPEPA